MFDKLDSETVQKIIKMLETQNNVFITVNTKISENEMGPLHTLLAWLERNGFNGGAGVNVPIGAHVKLIIKKEETERKVGHSYELSVVSGDIVQSGGQAVEVLMAVDLTEDVKKGIDEFREQIKKINELNGLTIELKFKNSDGMNAFFDQTEFKNFDNPIRNNIGIIDGVTFQVSVQNGRVRVQNGGSPYYAKYMKYKNKYNALKQSVQ